MAAPLKKIVSFFRYPLWVRLWFLPAWLLLGVARALILTVSFRRLAPRLGTTLGPAAWVPLVAPRQMKRASQIRCVVQLAAQYTPWVSNCFPQAVVARLLLGIHGIPYALCFGLMRGGDSGGFKAHAWVASGPVAVSGGNGFSEFTVVGCFVPGSLLPEGTPPRP